MKKTLLPGVAPLFGRPPHARTLGGGLQRLLLAAAVLLPALGQAQNRADASAFTQTSGTYTAITGGTAAGTATAGSEFSLDDAITNLPTGTVPFTFTYNGVGYTGLNISTNGFITFGTTAPAASGSTTGYAPISATTGYSGAVAPFGQDLVGGSVAGSLGEIRYQTLGSSPSRTFVIQWANFKRYLSSATQVGDNLNFQIRLSETSNRIDIVYGTMTMTTVAGSAQVGLRGASNADYNNRRSAVGWALTNTGAALTNSVTVSNSSTLAPASGLTFTYTPSTTAQVPAIRPTTTATTGSTATVAFVLPSAAPASISPAPTGYTATVTPSVVGSPFTSTTSPFNITGLSANTNYTVSIVANYAAGNSLPTETRLVTSTNCVAPTTLAITNNTTGTSASLSFTNAASGVTNYTVTTTPATSTYTVTSAPTGTPLALTGLSAATSYTVSVVSNCTAGGTAVAATTTFTTPSQPANFTTARNTGVAYTSIQSTGTSFTWQNPSATLITDDNISTTVPVTAGSAAAGATPFAFNYLGLNIQGFQVSTNGWLTFNTANATAAFGNNLSLITPNLVLAPFWDDLVLQGNANTAAALAAAKIKYQMSGTAPNRKLTIEWAEMEVYQNPGPNLNFEVILTETANTIEYRYGNMTGFDGSNNYTYTYSLGLNGITAATPNTYMAQDVANSNYFLQNNASVAAPTTITATTTLTAAQRGNSLSIAPACYTNIMFTPAASFTPNLPPAVAVPTNDEAAGALTLTLESTAPTDFCDIYSSANATASSGIAVCSAATAGTPDDDVWFKFVVPSPQNVTVTLRNAGLYDGVLQIFGSTGGVVNAGTPLACVNATGAGLSEVYTVTGLATGTYFVRVYEAGAGAGYNGAFALEVFATPTPPANDECAGAIVLPSNATTCTPVSGTTLAATASAGITACSAATPGNPDDDVWYQFTTGSTAVNDYNITLQGASGFDGVLQLFTGTCGSLTAVGCINSTSTGSSEDAVTNGLTASTTYYLRVYHAGAGTGSGNFTICVYRSCNPPASVAAGSVTATSANITFTNGGSGNFTVTATPTAGPGTTPVTATGTTGTTPGIALTGLVAGTTYSVVVQGDCGAGATSTAITFTTPVPAPANDNPTGAVSLALAATCTPTSGTNVGATTTTTNGYSNPGTCGIAASPIDVWYIFTTTASGAGSTSAVITVTGNPAGLVRVFSATGSAGPFTQVACSAGATNNTVAPALTVTGLTANTTYYVSVSGYGSGDTQGSFTICATLPPTCSAPTGVAVGSATTTTASVTFSGAGIGNTSYTATATPTTGSPITGTGTASPIALTGLTPGTMYSVVLAGNCGAAGAATPVTFTTVGPPPANDDCTGAVSLTPTATCTPVSGSTVNATTSTPASTCAGTADDDVWYSFVAGATTQTITVVGGTNFDAVVQLLSGTCAGLTSVSCVDATGSAATETITATNLTMGQTYYVRVYEYYSTGSSSGAPGSFTICVTQPADLVVTTGNSPYSASGTFNNVTIQNGGTANLSADLTVLGTLTINDGGTLNTVSSSVVGAGSFVLQAGGTLSTRSTAGFTAGPATTGAIRNTGTTRSYSNDASYVYNGTAAQSTGAGLPATVRNITVNNSTGLTLSQALNVRQLARMQGGNLATGGNTFTLLSVAGQGTALIDNTGGLVTGTGTMQRAIDATNPAGIGYRHYAAPVTNTTVADLNDGAFSPVVNAAYNSSAMPGFVTPFPTIFGYDETRIAGVSNNFSDFNRGWVSPTASSDALVSGKGYTVNIPDATLVDFVGTFKSGASNNTGLTHGPSTEAGWHLLGNPYPSPLNWDLVDNTPAISLPGMDAAMYVYQSTGRYTGTYRSYVNGVGNPLIDAGSGYFVRVAVAGTPGSVNLTDAHRVTTFGTQPAFGRSNDVRPLITLSLTGNGQQDETTVYFEAGATAGLDSQFDAVKRLNMGAMSLATVLNTQEFAINGLAPLTSLDVVVPLNMSDALAGTYSFDATALRNFGSTTVYLRDAATGTQTTLSQGMRYQFTLAANAGPGRFSLLFRPAGVTGTRNGFEAAQVLLYPNPAHGAFTLSVPAVANARSVQATLLNALGQQVSSRSLPLGSTGAVAEFSTANLAAGVYVLQLRAGEQVVTKRVVVE